MKYSFVEDRYKRETFFFNWMLIDFVLLIDKGFCPVREFVFARSQTE